MDPIDLLEFVQYSRVVRLLLLGKMLFLVQLWGENS